MVRGRKPFPTQLHVINGNPSKKNLNTNEPKPKPIPPDCPAWIKPEGKKLWKQLMPELERLGLMTIVDGGAFAAACQSWAEYVGYLRVLKKNGETYEYTNKFGATNIMPRPEVAMKDRALANYRAFCAEFGLTPASRVRLGTKPVAEDEDPMEALLGKSGGR